MAEDELAKLKQLLSNLKLPDIGERDEGYDGHYGWDGTDNTTVRNLLFFHTAVRSQNFEAVEQMLGTIVTGGEDGRMAEICNLIMISDSEEALKEALLLSISIGSRPLVEMVLTLFDKNPFQERCGASNSPNFPPHMTPLMLACIMNNFGIVQCLLLRGHHIQTPHYTSCECDECLRQTVNSRGNVRIVDVMRALCSEAYLWLATDDVFAACCSICKDLRQLIETDQLEYAETYRSLELSVQRFMARLADTAWRSEEFNTIVSQKDHCFRHIQSFSAPRLQMAKYAEMRQFTCSANVQITMKAIFRADWYNFGNKPSRDLYRTFRTTICVPFAILIHMIVPSMFKFFKIPLARFQTHMFMYTMFLLCAIVRPLCAHFDYQEVEHLNLLEWFLYAYIAGLCLERIKLFLRVGTSIYFRYWWRSFDCLLIASFLFSFIFFIREKFHSEAFDPKSINRVHWPIAYSGLLHEVFLSFACVIGISKMFYYMQLLKGIGGSVISVGNCVGKVYTYLIIMAIVIFSFSVGLNVIISPYLDRHYMDVNGEHGEKTTDDYKTVGLSTKNLFWSVFGYFGPSTYVAVAGNSGPEMEKVEHSVNTASLELLAALYHLIIIITLMNLMTSLLVKKADEVLDNEDMEFKYTRAAIYSEFMPWDMTAPPPFNLIYIPVYLIFGAFKREKNSEAPDSQMSENSNENFGSERDKFEKTMVTLFDRFISSKECKFKSIFRSEFDKEEKATARVSFLSPGYIPWSLDNTFKEPNDEHLSKRAPTLAPKPYPRRRKREFQAGKKA